LAVSKQFADEMRNNLDIQLRFKENQNELLQSQIGAAQAEKNLTVRMSHLKHELDVLIDNVGIIKQTFGLLMTTWHGLHTPSGRLIALLITISSVLLPIGFRQYSFISACTAGKFLTLLGVNHC
jgi:hypothetical protein